MDQASRREFLKTGCVLAGAAIAGPGLTAGDAGVAAPVKGEEAPATQPARQRLRRPARASKPNLLFILPDQQRADTLACYGNNQIRMPNVNRLAEQSVIFDEAYVTQPVCTPSRSSLLTGLFPHANGMGGNNAFLSDKFPCMPEMLPQGEYKTGYHGKWHLGDEVFAQHGFEDWVSAEDYYFKHFSAGRDKAARSSYHHWLVAQGLKPSNGSYFGRQETRRLPEEQNRPAFLAQEASRFIRANQENPFVLYVSFLEPHSPFMGPFDGMYDPAGLPLPANFNDLPGDDCHLKNRYLQRAWTHLGFPMGAAEIAEEKLNETQFHLTKEAQWRRMMAHYWGLCTLVDKYVGNILKTLEETGQMENTIIVYTSDHGDMMGSHHMVAKSVQYQEAARVPLLVRLPGGRNAGKRVSGPFGQIDLLPTLLDLMGEKVPAGLHGMSRKAVLEGSGNERLTDDVVIEWNANDDEEKSESKKAVPAEIAQLGTPEQIKQAMGDSIRTLLTSDGWKFNCAATGAHELFHLTTDPGETKNLAGAPEQKERMRDLRGRLAAWQKRTGDTLVLGAV
jgi:arylsulfatase A-like enzyme